MNVDISKEYNEYSQAIRRAYGSDQRRGQAIMNAFRETICPWSFDDDRLIIPTDDASIKLTDIWEIDVNNHPSFREWHDAASKILMARKKSS